MGWYERQSSRKEVRYILGACYRLPFSVIVWSTFPVEFMSGLNVLASLHLKHRATHTTAGTSIIHPPWTHGYSWTRDSHKGASCESFEVDSDPQIYSYNTPERQGLLDLVQSQNWIDKTDCVGNGLPWELLQEFQWVVFRKVVSLSSFLIVEGQITTKVFGFIFSYTQKK